jgi:formylglycine-generating enzyme required for sulfatase activity
MKIWQAGQQYQSKRPSMRSRRAILMGLGAFGSSMLLHGHYANATNHSQGRATSRQVVALGQGIELEMVSIPSGSFLMGAPAHEAHSKPDEQPQHRVTVPAFQIGRYPVTQRQWQLVMGNNPSHFRGDELPVEQVNWQQSVEFCQKLSIITGQKYRLPSEAEWEYACRAGTTTPYHFGKVASRSLANYYIYESSQPRQTTAVGSFSANAFGLHDMHGNVEEWSADASHSNYDGAPTDGSAWLNGNRNSYVVRGGSWVISPGYCRSANRDFYDSDVATSYIGLRVACS